VDKKPISRKAHGAIDYGFLGMMLAAPSLLGLTGAARTLSYLLGGVQGGLNAITDQPLAVKRLVPFRTHGTIELASGPAFVLLPVVTGALKQPKARAFFGAALGLLATVYALTDWDATTDG
jgi:hypothetical protein